MYYRNVKERLIKDSENRFGYHFSDEDFYIYFMIHGYKHYAFSGTGIRFLSDIYVFLRERGQYLDWGYVRKELLALKIQGFETSTRELAEKLFGGTDAYSLVGEEEKMLAYLMGAGTYGTLGTRIKRKLEEIQQGDGPLTVWTKLRYIWRRLFPDKNIMKQYFHFCRKHPWSIPFFWIYRLIRAATVRRKAVAREVQAMNIQAKD